MTNKEYLKKLRPFEIRKLASIYKIQDFGIRPTDLLIKELEKKSDLQSMPYSSEHTYTKKLLEYWDRNLQGKIEEPKYVMEVENECGDWIKIYANIFYGIISDIQFQVAGCCLSEACAGLTIELARKNDIETILFMTNEQLLYFMGIKVTPDKIDCATLALKCLKVLYEKTKDT